MALINRIRKLKFLIYLPPVIMLLVIFYDSWYSIVDCIPRDMVAFKKSKIQNGVVYKAFFNEHDHNHYTMYIRSNNKKVVLKPYYRYYGSDLSKVVFVGDTILKEQDSMSFLLKNNSKLKLVKFNCELGSVSDIK